jgi:glutathione S-transferase
MLKVWGRRSSANVQKVMWLIGELQLAHEHIPAGGPYGVVTEPRFRAMNPNGLVPVIEDDGVIMWESNAILRYLAATYGKDIFWFADPKQRAPIDQWEEWAATTFQPDMIGLFVNYWRTPENQRNPNTVRNFLQRSERTLRILDAELGKRAYIAGDKVSLADIATGTHLYRYYTMGTPYPSLPNVEAWYKRLSERAAYREHVMVSYEELRGRLSF